MSMKISHQWLKNWIDIGDDVSVLADKLTGAGLEVSAVEPACEPFNGVVIGEVLSAEAHPDAKKLKVCSVSTGAREPLTIVCGCATVCTGMRVAVATVGAKLPNDIHIKKAKLRGVMSHGMLCAAQELGIGDPSDQGILSLSAEAPLGEDFWAYIQADDEVVHVDLTPNRGDCASVLGVARECAALFSTSLKKQTVHKFKISRTVSPIDVHNQDRQACPHYHAVVIDGIDSMPATPLWMRERLRRAGLRLIHPAVDIANYVMMELGQPMHVFDAAKLNGSLQVRRAIKGEKLTLLDEQQLKLHSDDLVVADNAGPQALAGIMGGLDSGVSDTTTSVVLECAHFVPEVIAASCRRHLLNSDAAYRFERGVDANLPELALQHALALFSSQGATIGSASYQGESKKTKRPSILLPRDMLLRILGSLPTDKVVEQCWKQLGFAYKRQKQGWLVTPPGYRFDLTIPQDLVEEVARLIGYDNIVTQWNARPQAKPQVRPVEKIGERPVLGNLVAQGFHEVRSYSFISQQLQQLFSPDVTSCELANPIAEHMSVMRGSLWPGLCLAAKHNCHRQRKNLRLMEMGAVFEQQKSNIVQHTHIAGLMSGALHEPHWLKQGRKVDFFVLKGVCQHLLSMIGHSDSVTWKPAQHAGLHPGQTAVIKRKGEVLGYVGMLHPSTAQALDLPEHTGVFNILWDIFRALESRPFEMFSKYPSIRRDLALVTKKTISFADIRAAMLQSGSTLLQHVHLFDIYCGESIPDGHHSLAVGLTFQHSERTLVDQEVTDAVAKIVATLRKQFEIQVRE